MIRIRQIGDVAVLTFVDPAPAQPTVAREESFHQMISRGVRKVVIDLTQAALLPSVRIGDIILIDKTLHNVSGEMKLCLSEPLRDVLKTTKLDTMWKIYDNVDDAIKAFAAG
jgi:anti-anti-sigma regulatory factor